MEVQILERARSAPLVRVGGLLALLVLVLTTAEFRVRRALADPAFERWAAAPEDVRLWKSDPALLAYFVERIADAKGGVPEDWRHDPRVGHPVGADVPAEFTVGQEWIVAWSWLAVGRDVPLERVALRVSSVLASLALVGAAWAVLAATGSWGWALVAGALFALLPGNHRTLGFLLMREDLAWPLWSLHFGALVHALRTERVRSFVVAGAFLAGALATWHASRGFLALEACVLVGAYLVVGRPTARAAWTLVFLAAFVLVPALRASAWPVGELVVATALSTSGFVGGRSLGRRALVLGASLVAALGATFAAGALRGPVRGASFEHVSLVLGAKLEHLGVRPADPSLVPIDARLLWQGPFETSPPGVIVTALGGVVVAALAALAVRRWIAAPGRRRELLLGVAVLLGAALVAHLIGRTVLLAAWLVPVAAVVLLAGARLPRNVAAGLALVLLGAQAVAANAWFRDLSLSWYAPAGKPTEYARLFEWVERAVPPDEAVACDFVNATALLQATGNPIVLHPKYETAKSREAARGFFEAFYHGTPADLHAWCVAQEAEHLWIDRYVLGYVAPWVGGVRPGVGFAPGSAAATFLSQDVEVLDAVEGFELLYRSPPSIVQSNGAPYDLFRWYRVR